MPLRIRSKTVFTVLCAGTLAAFIASVLTGSVSFEISKIIETIRLRLTMQVIPAQLAGVDKILFNLRLPRTLMMLITGAALSCSGASYQGLFRNPLADPYLIGVSTGAGLGAIFAMSLRWKFAVSNTLLVPGFAFIFGLLTVFVVFRIGKIPGTSNNFGLILSGVAVNAFASALTSIWLLLSPGELRISLSWMLGGMSQNSWSQLAVITPLILLGIAGQISLAYPLNVLQFGEEEALSLGISIKKTRNLVILLSTLTTAVAISFAGIIGFVGLIVPHTIRLLVGGDYRKILPLSVLGGAFFLLTADVLSRGALAPQELPVGIITAITGAPFFLWLLQQARNNARRDGGI